MYYGYALYYKDRDGFELPIFHRHSPYEMICVTPNYKVAEKWLENEKKFYSDSLSLLPYTRKEGFWLWKRDVKIWPDPIPAEKFMLYNTILATIFIKKVKLV